MKITRAWAMPNKQTFNIKPIGEVVSRYLAENKASTMFPSIDPFAGDSRLADITNDLDPEKETDYHLDALAFLQRFETEKVDVGLVLFDPPYSPRQVSECYRALDMTVNMQTTSAKFWGDLKKQISKIVTPGGYAISCGWNSGGIGKSNGFEIVEILLVAHGGWHNDTIVTVEKKTK